MDKVDEMPAGRDLDRVVAVRVMGQNVYDTPPLYSSDIGAAWEVVERMRDHFHMSFGCWDTPTFSSFAGKIAAFRKGVHSPERNDQDAFVGSGHMEGSMPLAICRAALKTLEDE